MSELAQQLIAENLQTQNPVLDLGNCGLDGTEDELYKLFADADHIESLVLSNEWHDYDEENGKWELKSSQNSEIKNRLIQTPSYLPKKLTTLGLVGEWKNKDISSLKDLTQLQSLDLGESQIQDPSYLRDLTQLQSLNLNGCGLPQSWTHKFCKFSSTIITRKDHEKKAFFRGSDCQYPQRI